MGDEYGLTKKLFKDALVHKKHKLIIVDTPGLRRKNKVLEKNELARNKEVIKLMKNVEVIILLIDSSENITKQDFRLADLSISNNKILFFYLIKSILSKIRNNLS